MLQQPITPAQRYVATDTDALIRSTIPLVRKIAWHVHARVASAIEVEDLIQIGTIALIEAARTYEDRGHAFSTYASMRIRGAMIDHLRREARIARSAMQRRRQVEATRASRPMLWSSSRRARSKRGARGVRSGRGAGDLAFTGRAARRRQRGKLCRL